jgi:hypothetical protein
MDEPEATINAARSELLAAIAEGEGLTLLEVVRAYNSQHRFKSRIDHWAQAIASPPSLALH